MLDGLDAATKTRVAHTLFGLKGVLRESADITSIIATHSSKTPINGATSLKANRKKGRNVNCPNHHNIGSTRVVAQP